MKVKLYNTLSLYRISFLFLKILQAVINQLEKVMK